MKTKDPYPKAIVKKGQYRKMIDLSPSVHFELLISALSGMFGDQHTDGADSLM